MTCAPLQTGERFLGGVLAQIDCHAQAIGAYGYGALAAPNSPLSGLLLALLTVFIALFGLRLMFGEAPGARDLVSDILKVGIVLTLATSWPAWRTLAYHTVLDAPSAVAGAVGSAAGVSRTGEALNDRLDRVDRGILSLTAFGTGRLTGGIVGGTDLGDSTSGIALADQSGFGWGRVAFLAGTIAPLAAVRLTAGILLAAAPLICGLLLFAGTRDIFIGWLRALAACALASIGLSLIYLVEAAMLEGWLRSALTMRQANVLTPAAPTELIVLALAFALAAWGLVGLLVRAMFFSSARFQWLPNRSDPHRWVSEPALAAPGTVVRTQDERTAHIRAHSLSDAVALAVAREERAEGGGRRSTFGALEPSRSDGGLQPQPSHHDALGASFRRSQRRSSAAAASRDQIS